MSGRSQDSGGGGGGVEYDDEPGIWDAYEGEQWTQITRSGWDQHQAPLSRLTDVE